MRYHNPIQTAAAAILFSAALNSHALGGTFQNGEFITYSQDDWGTETTPAAQLLLNHFFTLYPSGVEIGISGAAGNSAFLTTPEAVFAYLPANGLPGALENDSSDPTSTEAGTFGGYVLSLQLNVDFNDAGFLTGSSGVLVGDLVLHDLTAYPLFNGLSVRQFLIEVNQFLGGNPPPYSYKDLATLTDDVARAFESGTPSQFAQDHLQLPGKPCPADIAPSGGNGVVNVNDLLLVIGNWGATGSNSADINGDLVVDVNDLLAVVGAWGPCP